MSNVTVTGNEAQFNENVDFLKNVVIQGDIEIRGTLSVPPLASLTIDDLTLKNVFGNPNTTFHNKVTFLDTVSFPNALSFTDLEIRDRLAVGVGGTVLVADSRLNPGKVGIGSEEPKELLDVGGKAKIIDLDLRNLYVAGLSTFVGVSSFRDDVFFNGSSGITSIRFDHDANSLKFVTGAKAVFGADGGNTKDLEIYHDGDHSYIQDSGTGDLVILSNQVAIRNAAETEDMARFYEGDRVELRYANSLKFQTTGIGVSVLGDLIVPDVGGRISRVGIGTTFPANPAVITELDDASQGPLRLDIAGSIAIGRNLYDSVGQHGENGMFLRRNVYGVRWVAVEPSEDQMGIVIQDEGQEIPLTGVAQTFHTLNFVQGNSTGIGTDTLIPTAQNIPGTGIATITTFDLWGYVGSGNNAPIYRMSKVGINNSNPTYQLDINGTLHAVGLVQFDDTLTVEEHTELNKTLNVDGAATFQDNVTINADNKFFKIQTNGNVDKFTVDTDNGNTDIQGTLDVTGATTLKDTLDVTGAANFNNTDNASSSTSGGSVTIDGGAAVAKKLYVGSDFDVKGNTQLGDADSDSLTVDATSTFKANITAEKDLDVDGHTELDDLNVTGITTFQNDIDANQNLDVDGDTTLDKLTVDELATFNGNIDANQDLDVDGRTELDTTNISESLNVVGFTTLAANGGITTHWW